MGKVQEGDTNHYSQFNPFYKSRLAKCTICGDKYIKRAHIAKYCYVCRLVQYNPHKLPNWLYEQKFGKSKQLSVATLPTDVIPKEAREVGCEWVWLLCWRILEGAKKEAFTQSKTKVNLVLKQEALRFLLGEDRRDDMWFRLLCALCHEDVNRIRNRAMSIQKEAA